MDKKELLKQKTQRQQALLDAARNGNRALADTEQAEFDSLQREIDTLKREIDEEERAQGSNDGIQRALQAERERYAAIAEICGTASQRGLELDMQDFIKRGLSIEQVNAEVLKRFMSMNEPISSGRSEGNLHVHKDEADKMRAAASDALQMRAFGNVENPAEGAREMRGMKLRDIAVECLQRSGVTHAYRLDDDELLRRALSPESQFASILSDTVNKSMARGNQIAQTTFERWTSIGSNPDFKGATHYQISEAGDLTRMSETGEFTFDELKDQGVKKSIATFGKKFGFTRQAMINDDLGILTKIPMLYVQSARRGINKLVYQQLMSNPTIFDNKPLFHADHGNLGTAGALSNKTLAEMKTLMKRQKGIAGKQALNISPKFLIVPPELENEALQLLTSMALPGQQNAGVNNIWRNALELVVDAELEADGSNLLNYFLAADPMLADTIEVTYLNGDDMPKLESRMGFDFLGMEWRIYMDYGVTVTDFKGLAKNNGVALS